MQLSYYRDYTADYHTARCAESAFADRVLQQAWQKNHAAAMMKQKAYMQIRCCRELVAGVGTVWQEVCRTNGVVDTRLQKACCRCEPPGRRWETGCRRLGKARDGNRCRSVTGLLLDDMPICASPSSYSPLPNRWCPYLRWISSSSRLSGSDCTKVTEKV